jgi:transposase-like protein
MNQKSQEIWKQRIADRKSSGLSVADWCKKNNLTKHAYYYWWKRVESTVQNSEASIPIFIEIKPEYIEPLKAVKLVLPITWNDINFTVTDSDTAKLAAEFISQLQKLC